MAKTLVALGAAVVISAVAFTHSTPATAEPWVAPAVAGSFVAGGIVGAAVASSPCYGGYSGGVDCFGNPLRGLFTAGFGGNCGCESSSYRSYGPTTYYTEPAQPYVQPYYHHRYTRPYVRPSYRFRYRHFYRPYVRHDYHRYGAYRPHDRAHNRRW